MSVYCIVNSRQKLHDPTRKIFLNEPLQYDNAQAHCFRLTLTADDGTSPADLSDVSVVANFMRPDGGTVEIATGTITGNVVEVILPAACYSSVGRYKLTVNLVEGSGESAAARTAMIVEGITERNTSGTPVDPGTIMPSINDLIQEIEDARAEIEPEYTNLVNGVVRHDMVQSLTPAQQTQALNNIGAADAADFDAVAYPMGVVMLNNLGEAVRVLSNGISNTGGDLNSTVRARTQYFSIQPGHRYMFSLDNAEFVIISAWEYTGSTQGSVIGRVSPSGYTTSRFAFTASGKFARVAFAHADTTVAITDDDKAAILAAISLKETASDNLAPVDTPTATVTHAAGSLLTVSGQLYKATQAIVAGDTITPGTNVEETTVAAQFAERDAAISSAVSYDTAQDLTLEQKAKARVNIGAQSRIEPDGAVALDLSGLAAVYISGNVGQKIVYKNSTASMTYKRIAWVQAGCAYVLSATSGTLSSVSARSCAITDASDIILQRFDWFMVENGTAEVTFTAEADGLLCVCVDTSTTTVTLHGGPLYGTVRYDTAQSLEPAQQEQARENIGAASETGFETVTGFVPFDGENGTVTNRNLTVTRAGQRYTVSRTSAHTSNTDLCLMPNLHAANYQSSGANYDNWVTESRVALIPGKRYRMAVRVISGAFPTNEYFNLVAMNDAGQSLSNALAMSNGSRYVDFTFEGTYLTIVGYARAAFATGETPLVFDLAVCDSPEGASIADRETYIARENHNIGGLMMWQGQLYKATQAIAAGETIAPGTNVAETTVAAQIAERDTAIAGRAKSGAIAGSLSNNPSVGDLVMDSTGDLYVVSEVDTPNVGDVSLTPTTVAAQLAERDTAIAAVSSAARAGVLAALDAQAAIDFGWVAGDQTKTGAGVTAVRNGNRITLNGTATSGLSSAQRFRMMGNLVTVNGSPTAAQNVSGAVLTNGHRYMTVMRLVSGTAVYSGDGTGFLTLAPYKSGSTSVYFDEVTTSDDYTYYIRGGYADGSPLTLWVSFRSGWTFTNATYEVSVYDMTAKAWQAFPPTPTTDGTYTLKVTVTNGVPAYSWAAN